jgi:nucleoside-diphosphate-sugar epimerase
VDVRDVAALFLYTIEHPHEANGERYIASSAVGHPQAFADILRHELPETRDRIQEGSPGQGYLPSYEVDEKTAVKVDSGKAKKALGRDWIGLGKSVIDTAESFKSLL